jgi:hypothetical protein
MPALIIVIDEYAELKDEAPDAIGYADAVARLGRAVAVTLIAATQRPTQRAMGEGAVRSQMDLRVCFRVREPRDVDLILGQGMLRAGWDAHKLNAPGKFLVSAPEHDSPKRARCYQVTDQAVTGTAAYYARYRPGLDEISRRALTPPENPPRPDAEYDPPGIGDGDDAHRDSGDVLWAALCQAPEEGTHIRDLMRLTGWKHTKLYRHLREHAQAGRAIQVKVAARLFPPFLGVPDLPQQFGPARRVLVLTRAQRLLHSGRVIDRADWLDIRQRTEDEAAGTGARAGRRSRHRE